ncbi:hypothetical protein [Amycolatopsis rubida]|uniref:hypothetical protein n=1 Tax=Amycolatopsis rubida TaxID=112413 RepID=UPI001160A201|nr:hypothetical protein [Amycolatopsis rubida]
MFLLCALPARLFGLVLALSASAVVVCVIRPGRPFREPELRTAASAGFLIVVLLISRTARFSGQRAALARSCPRSAGLPARQAPQRVLAVVVPLDRRVAPGLLDQLGHVLVAARMDEPLAVAGATDARGIGESLRRTVGTGSVSQMSERQGPGTRHLHLPRRRPSRENPQ